MLTHTGITVRTASENTTNSRSIIHMYKCGYGVSAQQYEQYRMKRKIPTHRPRTIFEAAFSPRRGECRRRAMRASVYREISTGDLSRPTMFDMPTSLV